MIRGKEQASIMGKCLEKRGFGREASYIQTQNDTQKKERKYKANCLDKRVLRRKERYIEPQNNTGKRARKIMESFFKEIRVN
jgi:hypothetical protein